MVEGRHAYGLLRAEHGVHRLVRMSPFNAQGKRQTAFAALKVTPFLSDVPDIAMQILKAKLAELAREEREEELSAIRGQQRSVGFGSQIRSYVLQPYQMVKDLRTGVTSSSPSDVLDGDLDSFMAAALSQRVTGEAVEVEDVD